MQRLMSVRGWLEAKHVVSIDLPPFPLNDSPTICPQARIVSCGGWRSLQMALACDNHLVQRAAIEAMSNLVTHNDVVERCAAVARNVVQ